MFHTSSYLLIINLNKKRLTKHLNIKVSGISLFNLT